MTRLLGSRRRHPRGSDGSRCARDNPVGRTTSAAAQLAVFVAILLIAMATNGDK
jgi:hypothetical protein